MGVLGVVFGGETEGEFVGFRTELEVLLWLRLKEGVPRGGGGRGRRNGQSNPGPCRRIRIRTEFREPSHPEDDSHHHHHKEERCTASDPTKQTAAQHLPAPQPARHTADSTTLPSRLRGPESAGYPPPPPPRLGALPHHHRPSPGPMVPCLRRWRAAAAAGGSTAAGHGADTTAEGRRRTRPGSRDSRSGTGGSGRGRRGR